MAKPIKITPVLRGRDAINFYSHIEENKTKKVSKDFLSSVKLAAEKFQQSLKKGN
ncbi:hypothetical protein ACH3O9_06145 [Leeuwenhoekiella sp. A16]|uniref:hypothetical protein n=1 Tax=unclassified Leeuwenhoekiella TaxID=2615029 RepID=UPI003A813AE9